MLAANIRAHLCSSKTCKKLSGAKAQIRKFNGEPKHTLYLHLIETEYRFNHRDSLYLETSNFKQ